MSIDNVGNNSFAETQEQNSRVQAQIFIREIKNIKEQGDAVQLDSYDPDDPKNVEKYAFYDARHKKAEEFLQFLIENPITCREMYKELWREYFLNELAQGKTIEELENVGTSYGKIAPTDAFQGDTFGVVTKAFGRIYGRGTPDGLLREEVMSQIKQEKSAHESDVNLRVEDENFDKDKVISNFLSYADADIPEETKKLALENSRKNPQAIKYADSIIDLINERGKQALMEQTEQMRVKCIERIIRLGLIPSPYAKSQTWAMWDIGKQEYFFTHQEEADEKYLIADPFSEEKQKEIIDRHIGWEAYQAFKADGDIFMEKIKNHPNRSKIQVFLQKTPKENGTLSSLELADLGSLLG